MASAMALYLSLSNGTNLSKSSSSTPTETYWERTNSRKACCLELKFAPMFTLAFWARSNQGVLINTLPLLDAQASSQDAVCAGSNTFEHASDGDFLIDPE